MAELIKKADVPGAAAATVKAVPPPAPSASLLRHENKRLASLPEADLALLTRHLQAITLPAGAALGPRHLALDHVYFPADSIRLVREARLVELGEPVQ